MSKKRIFCCEEEFSLKDNKEGDFKCSGCGTIFTVTRESKWNFWMALLKKPYHWSDGKIHDVDCKVVGSYEHQFSHIISDAKKREFEDYLQHRGVRHCFEFVKAKTLLSVTRREKEDKYSVRDQSCEDNDGFE